MAKLLDNQQKVFVGADLTRSAELLFRPHICGMNIKGIFESIKDIVE